MSGRTNGPARRVDLNCDMGEGFGIYELGADQTLLRHVTSANLACGFHAGDPGVMRRTVEACLVHGVAIGAHPGLPDRQGFGRRAMAVTEREVHEMTLYQIGALYAFVHAAGGRLAHVKPHGALYHMLASDAKLAAGFVRAVRSFDPQLIVIGPPDSKLQDESAELGLIYAVEGFADRTYRRDGTLASRSEPGSVIEEPEDAVNQALSMLRSSEVRTVDGGSYALAPRTLCIHGDSPAAVAIVRALASELPRAGFAVEPLSR